MMKHILLLMFLGHFCFMSFGQETFTKILEIPWNEENGCKTELRPEGNFGLSDYHILNNKEIAVLCDVEHKIKIYNIENNELVSEFLIDYNCQLFTYSKDKNAFYIIGKRCVFEYSYNGILINKIILNEKIRLPVALRFIKSDLYIITSYKKSYKLVDDGEILKTEQQILKEIDGEIMFDETIIKRERSGKDFSIDILKKGVSSNYSFKAEGYDSPGIKFIGQDKNYIFLKFSYFIQVNPIIVNEQILIFSKKENKVIERILIPNIFYVIILNEIKYFNGNLYHLISTPDAACFYKIDIVSNGKLKSGAKYPDNLDYEYHYNINLKKKIKNHSQKNHLK